MPKNNPLTQTREELFREKAKTYTVCHSATCTLKDRCLRSLLAAYTPTDSLVTTSINLNNPSMQTADCPMYRSDEPRLMPVGLKPIFHDMPGWMERAVKNTLIQTYSRKRYYEYHNGTRPLTPDVEARVREVVRSQGWQQDLHFASYVEEYLW